MPKYQAGFEWEEMRDAPVEEAVSACAAAKDFALCESGSDEGEDTATVFVCDAGEPNRYCRFEIRLVRTVETHIESVRFHSILETP